MSNYPKTLFYMIDILCNEKCSKCSHWKYNSQRTFFDINKLISFINDIDSLDEFVIVGGEPLIYREDIIRILENIKRNIKTTIITNGVLANEEFINEVKKYNVHFVFSIDTINKDFWKFVRGKDSYELVMKNFDYALKALKPEQLSIQSVLSKETEEYIKEVREWANEISIYHGVQHFIADGFDGSWTETNDNKIIIEDKCYAYLYNMSIMPNGDIYTCFQQNLINNCNKPLGNLRNDSFISIISSDYFQDVVERMKKCKLPCRVLKCNIEKS